MKEKLKRTLVLIGCAVAIGGVVPAMAGTLDDAFDELGSYGNVTGPGAYEGQVSNYYTGGALFMRSPNKTYQLVTINPPRIRAGCGGIDAYLGAFSHINLDGFVAMLRNIGSNALGLAFQVAIDVLEPLLGTNLKDLAAKVNHINKLNIDSCKTAKAMWGTVHGKMAQDTQNWTADWTRWWNTFPDQERAQNESGNETVVNNAMTRARSGTEPAALEASGIGNVVWRALVKQGNSEPAERMLLLNLVGTTSFFNTGIDPPVDFRYYPPKLTFDQILAGRMSPTGTPAPNLDFEQIWVCDDYSAGPPAGPTSADACVTMTLRPVAFLAGEAGTRPYIERVNIILTNIANNIRNGTVQGPEEMRLIGASTLPVYKMAAVAVATPGGGAHFLRRYADAIAIDYTAAQIESMIGTLREAFAKEYKSTSKENQQRLTELTQELNRLDEICSDKRALAGNILQTTQQLGEELAMTERHLFSNMSPMLKANVAYGR